jgi:hypothetical protein
MVAKVTRRYIDSAGLLPFTATCAPAFRNASTIARPMPRERPVIMSLLPDKSEAVLLA